MNNNNSNPLVIIVGTRPEGIKMIPLYKALKKAGLPILLCSTMQHNELLSQVFDLFNVKADFNLDIMRMGQDLFYITHAVLQKTKEIFSRIQPSLVIVQGDTTSTMAAALSAFYLKIPIAHIEAGLRTGDILQPFPEEANRKLVSQLATYHFTPTKLAQENLFQENIKDNIFCVGNTVVDALHIIQEKTINGDIKIRKDIQKLIKKRKQEKKKIILLTTHRRESFNGGIENILCTIKKFLQKNPNSFCFYPFHPNPQVIQAIEKTNLHEVENLYMCEPISYAEMIHVISNADLIITDSGGIQEEAVALGKPVLVLREKTERIEGVLAGLAHVVGTDEKKIERNIYKYINFESKEKNKVNNLYGDGNASEKIIAILKEHITCSPSKVINRDSIVKEKPSNIAGNRKMKKVCVLGLGYIGLPTALILAENKFDVIGFDVDETRVIAINNGDPVIEEPELYEKLHIALGYGNFTATTQITNADYFIIAVPTPFKENKQADLSYVKKAAEFIATVIKKGNTVLLESTVPVGATEQLAKLLEQETTLKAGNDFYVAHCPERVLPGKIFKELVENDRIVGGINQKSAYQASLLYDAFSTGEIHLTDDKTAEMVKLIENSSRDAQIAFAHQVASMARIAKRNPYEIINLANKHPRVNIFKPTAGVGGHCIAIDPWFLVESFPNNCNLIKAARETNDKRPKEIIKSIHKTIKKWEIANKKRCNVLVLGLTYKPDVDDLRESPALQITNELCKIKTIDLYISEPNVKKQKLETLFNKKIISVQEGLQHANVVVYLVSHKRFKAIDKKLLKNKLILDFCGITYRPKENDQTTYKSGMLDFFITNSYKEGQL